MKRLLLSDLIDFGRHKNQSLEYIIVHHPTYIEWAIEQNVIAINNEASQLLEEMLTDYYENQLGQVNIYEHLDDVRG